MKKNISINISGIIFHIEEDGYETLRKYMDSISKYFSSFEDSSEIMADIESRMAEIFLSKLNEGKQVITAEDVTALITTLGSVKDFKAAEDQNFEPKEESYYQNKKTDYEQNYTSPKQLFRDTKRKSLGGVCAGLGSYLNVDPIWIRLLFAMLTFVYGITIIAYIVMWFVVPESNDLPEPTVNKKMFRDADRKVLGGVAGGLSSYLGVDIIAIRVLFIVFTITGGLGILAYIVFWLILPEAKTLTDKMQMQGEPVTLSNIESTLNKKNQHTGTNENEALITQLLLLPFRILAAVIKFAAKLIIPIVDVLRVAIGIFVMLLGLMLILAFVVIGGIVLGLLSGNAFGLDNGFPTELIHGTFPGVALVAAFAVAVIPAMFIALLGISTVAKRIVFSPTVTWTLFVIFFIGVMVLGNAVPGIVHTFKNNGEYKVEKTFRPAGKTVVLALREAGLDGYDVTNLELRGYNGNDFKLVQTFEAQGTTRADAITNAQTIEYQVDFKDSTITFDSNIQFKSGAKFSAQRLDMILYIPFGFPFVMDREMSRFITQYVDRADMDGNTWKMTFSGLSCITCSAKESDNTIDREDLADFTDVDVNGVLDLTITQGDNYSVTLNGSEREKEKYDIYRNGNTLVIDYKAEDNDKFFWKKNFSIDKMHINVTMPQLEKLEAKGAGNINFYNFNSEDLDIEVLGAMHVSGDVRAKYLTVKISGASSLQLDGSGKSMDVTIEGASNFKASDYRVKDASVIVNGASHAYVNVSRRLEMEESFASKVDYQGDPEIIKHD